VAAGRRGARRRQARRASARAENSGECRIDIVTDGEQSRQHFVRGFLAGIDGIDFGRRVRIGIRDNRYEAIVPAVTEKLRRRDSVHAAEALIVRTHTTRRLKFTLPGPMTIADTIADAHYGDRTALAMAFAELLNEEARDLAALGVDVIQFDEPAFNVYLDDVVGWGIDALHRAAADLPCRSAVHICYGYGIPANIERKRGLGREWRQYERIFPALAESHIDQVSLECANSRVPIELLALLAGKDVQVGAVDVASDEAETPEQVAATIERALRHVPPERLFPCTNCGMAPLDRTLANQKLAALAAGAALVRGRSASVSGPGYDTLK
jgi:5-methyltetrahydropteroyltriglutamate--homocysteine methyltransferase